MCQVRNAVKSMHLANLFPSTAEVASQALMITDVSSECVRSRSSLGAGVCKEYMSNIIFRYTYLRLRNPSKIKVGQREHQEIHSTLLI